MVFFAGKAAEGTSVGGAGKDESAGGACIGESAAALRLGRFAFSWLDPIWDSLTERTPAVETLRVDAFIVELSPVAAFPLGWLRTFAALLVATGLGALLRPSFDFLFAIVCIKHIAAQGAVYEVYIFKNKC